MIRKLFYITIFSAISFAFTLTATAQAKNYRESYDSLRSSVQGTNTRAAGLVSIANQQAFQTGKDFAMAIEDSKYMGTDDEFFNFTVVDLVYLIDGLEGQPEAQTLQTMLKGIIRNTKDLSVVSTELQAISKAFIARQTAERKWYFNVGSAQMNTLIAGWNSNSTGATKTVKELQGLMASAPQGTPQIVLDAIKGLAKYGVKITFVKEDFTAMVNDTKLITTLVYA